LLAEANQWPSEVRAYFGEGDECHMAFHFPLMPRIFMALRQEERHPIIEILNQTPDIPETCQWAIFLRNHDELTLEMVTDEERDYMYAQYAAEPQARLNLGIRRRLAPLMENSRPRIELMHSLLFSLPGTPVIYYGDEIGMGDNVYLGDRNGVRTPMQWTGDRNAGFSRADPARLYFPVIMDPVYGFESINVESQERSPFSLLHWMKRMIALRARHQVFGRGTIEFIRTPNRKVLTYLRRLGDERILCVANLSRTVQPVEIPLQQFGGLTPVEMLGQAEFPRIGDQPYLLTLAPYGFYWFQLQQAVVPVTARTAPLADEHGALPLLFAGVVWDSILDGSMRTIVERQALCQFLERQRWFGGKARPLAAARFLDWTTLRRGPHPAFLTIIEAEYRDGGRERYGLPLAMSNGAEATAIEQHHPEAVMARITGARKGLLHDGLFDDGTCELLWGLLRDGRELRMRTGQLRGNVLAASGSELAAMPVTPIARTGPDQSNTSVIFGWRLLMKMFRHIEEGANPDVEIGRFLTERRFSRVPPLLGEVSYERPEEAPASVFMFQRFIANQGNGWSVTIDELGRYFERVLTVRVDETAVASLARDVVTGYLATAETLGRRTGELHAELSSEPADPSFAPERITPPDMRALMTAMYQRAGEQLRLLAKALPSLPSTSHGTSPRALAEEVLAHRQQLLDRFESLRRVSGGLRIRCHGDYHLGQVLITEGDIVILDFEGEPARPLAERRAKMPPLRDVAGMLRSFSYAALTGLEAATVTRPDDRTRLAPWADAWERLAGEAFLGGYMETARGAAFLPSRPDDVETVLQAFVLDKAMYELGYELNNRPDWVHIPLRGLLALARQPLRRVT
jgi:maltose alpha-D-glucosyltransferase/alpha-amylase